MLVAKCRKLFKLYLLIGGRTMTKKDARGCITRTVFKYTVTATGEVYVKLPTPAQLARKYPNGYSVTTENELYALPLERFLENCGRSNRAIINKED